MVDMVITALTRRFKEPQPLQSIFGFLMGSTDLKSLDGSQLKDQCTKYAKISLEPDHMMST
jgi:hypothetical protein